MSIARGMLNRLPNTLSFGRVLLAPILALLAWLDRPDLFLGGFLIALLTDALDGFLARRFSLQSPMGARMDSWADALCWMAFTLGAFRLWPDIIGEQIAWIGVALSSFLMPGLLGLFRYHRLASLHTPAAKLAMISMGVSVFFLFGDVAAWPFRMSVIILALAGVEETLIILCLPDPPEDVHSLRQAWRKRNALRRT